MDCGMRAKIYDFKIQIRNRMCTHELVQLVWRLRRKSGKVKPPMFFLRWTVDFFDGCICFLRLHFGPPGTACDRQRSSKRSQGQDRFEISQANILIFTGLEMLNENQFRFKCKWLVMSESSPATCLPCHNFRHAWNWWNTCLQCWDLRWVPTFVPFFVVLPLP